MVFLVFIMTVSCGVAHEPASSESALDPALPLMLVADMGAEIIVEDIDVAQNMFDFVQELGGYIATVTVDELKGMERMTIEFRVPHEHAGLVADKLMHEFGEVTYINVLAADVSVRNARLRRELATMEGTLGEQSGAKLSEIRDEIDLLRDSIAFQLERVAFLFVTVELIESH